MVKRVAVTGAAGQIGYSLLPRIATGEIFGPETQVRLQCLELTPALESLKGVAMELDDCAFPLLTETVCTDNLEEAFEGADLVLLVGSKPRSAGMERKDLLLDNGPIFTGQGKAIEAAAGPNVRVVVVGNPCNTNCLIAMNNAKSVPADRWTAMTQLDHNRAQAQLALKAGVDSTEVKNIVIWGNHSNTQFPDWSHATIGGKPAADVIGDDAWLKNIFIPTVQERGKAIIEARGKSSAMSAGSAALDHARYLFQGTPDGEWTSIAIVSDGKYGVPEGLICSVPVTCPGDGTYKVVEGLEFSDFGQDKFQKSIDELSAERDTVSGLL